jgi:hypothetical protein
MFKKEEMKSEKNRSNAHVVNQTKSWPKAFNPFVLDQKTFPRSWYRFPLNS